VHEYPTEADLATIANWDPMDFDGWMEFVRELWAYPEYWSCVDGHHRIATGGWSGNECLIGAMQENVVAWSLYWKSSTRGGAYEFCESRRRMEARR
jgi:hypothetical protein